MIESIKRKEYTYKGRRVILDTAMLSVKKYETMLLRVSDGEEIAVMTAATEFEAMEQFDMILAAHPADKKVASKKSAVCGPLTGKYAQLCEDIKKALVAGRAVEDANAEDGGACNFDSAAVALPRWSTEKVKQAAKEAGTSCFIWNLFGVRHFVFSPNTKSQGNARSRNAEAMTAALRSMGYNAMDYCQMD